MIGTGLATAPEERSWHERRARHGRAAGLRARCRSEADEPLFHADWERRALGLTLAMGASGQWNIDLSRAARESLPPATYLSSSYYEIWIRGLEKLMLQRGLVRPTNCSAANRSTPPRRWRAC
jgi:hypothetical protein